MSVKVIWSWKNNRDVYRKSLKGVEVKVEQDFNVGVNDVKSNSIFKKWFDSVVINLPEGMVGSFNEEKGLLMRQLTNADDTLIESVGQKKIELCKERIDELVWEYALKLHEFHQRSEESVSLLTILKSAMDSIYQSYENEIEFIKEQIHVQTECGYYTKEQEEFLLENVDEVGKEFGLLCYQWFSSKHAEDFEALPLEEELDFADKAISKVAGKEIIMITAYPLKDNLPAVEIDISRRDLERVLLEVYKDDEKWPIEDFLMEYTWDNGDVIKDFIECHPEFCKDSFKVTDFANAKYAVIITNCWENDSVGIYEQSKQGLYPEVINESFMKGLMEKGFEGSRILVTDIENPTWENVIFDGRVDENVFAGFEKAMKEKGKYGSLDDKLKEAAEKCSGNLESHGKDKELLR